MLFVIAASACPHTDFLKPLARIHLPFPSLEEIVSRIVSAYLLFQYFRTEQGPPFDHALSGLIKSAFVPTLWFQPPAKPNQ